MRDCSRSAEGSSRSAEGSARSPEGSARSARGSARSAGGSARFAGGSRGLVAAVLIVAALLGVAACTTTPAVTVVRTTPGDKSEQLKGDPVKLKRGPQDAYAGARGGFYVVRGAEDWEAAWPTDKAPPMPAGLDTSSHMVFLAVSDTKNIARVKVQRVLETATFLYVWVRETKVGEGCRNRSSERAFDAVVARRADKPVKFFVDEERGESCGEAPVASVECRLAKQETWATKVVAQPGDAVECELTASAPGKFALVDRVLSMADIPAGSTAKLAFRKGPTRGDFEVDVYGTYTVGAEAADEAGRRGKATATIEVAPPKTKDVLVQLVWAGFDIKDESDTFPRVNLRVAEEGPKGQRCSAEIPIPGLCEVKTRGAYTYMRIPEGSRKLPVSVQFLDERVEKGPGPCVHVWYDGARTVETCDRRRRDVDEIWRVGTLDTSTGKLIDDDSTPSSSSSSDAGAPATAADAGAKKPAPKSKKP